MFALPKPTGGWGDANSLGHTYSSSALPCLSVCLSDTRARQKADFVRLHPAPVVENTHTHAGFEIKPHGICGNLIFNARISNARNSQPHPSTQHFMASQERVFWGLEKTLLLNQTHPAPAWIGGKIPNKNPQLKITGESKWSSHPTKHTNLPIKHHKQKLCLAKPSPNFNQLIRKERSQGAELSHLGNSGFAQARGRLGVTHRTQPLPSPTNG